MTIEIHEPELEAIIEERMASGHFESVEDFLLDALRPPDLLKHPEALEVSPSIARKQNLADFLLESPLRGLDLPLTRNQDYPRALDL